MLFGGSQNGDIMVKAGQTDEGYRKMNDLIYSVYQITLMGEFHWDSLVAVDKLMAQVSCQCLVSLLAQRYYLGIKIYLHSGA